jgi:hypothetical protein
MMNAFKLWIIAFTVIIVCPASAQTEGDFNVDLTDDESGVVIKGYTGKQRAITIPAKIQGYPVKEIGNNAFKEDQDITSVNIPASVISIGDSAFENCQFLTSVNIPASVTSIGSNAFLNCRRIATVNFPEGLVEIGYQAFARCSALKTIKLPNSLTKLGEGAFVMSGLTSVTLGNRLTYITAGAFYSTPIITIVIPEGVTGIMERAFNDCTALTTVTLPSTLKEIRGLAFKGCSALTTVTIPAALTSVAFGQIKWNDNNGMQYVTPDWDDFYSYKISSGDGVFDGCDKLLLATRAALKKVGWDGSPENRDWRYDYIMVTGKDTVLDGK